MKEINLVLSVLILAVVLAIFVGKARVEQAYVYKNNTTGELLYCSNEYEHAPAEPRDFTLVGTANVSSKDIKLCELE